MDFLDPEDFEDLKKCVSDIQEDLIPIVIEIEEITARPCN